MKNNEIEQGKINVAFQLMIEWFQEHEQAKEDVKDYMSRIFTKEELSKMFEEDEDDTVEYAFKDNFN